MRQCPRTIIKILIEERSPLSEGRLPINFDNTPDGIIARVDPVSYGALLASVGNFFPLEEVAAHMLEMAKKSSTNNLEE